MGQKQVQITLTETEAKAVLFALGNSIYDGTDRDVFDGSPQQRLACWRGHDKLKSAVYGAKGNK